MFFELFGILGNLLLVFILHVTGNGAFPRPLSPQEEKEYLLLSRQGDKNARNKLVEHNLRLVAHIIKKYYANINDQDDLVSIGTIGLIKAINTFDPSKNIKLSSYASRCIENEILMFFRNNKKSAQDISLNEAIGPALPGQSAITSSETTSITARVQKSTAFPGLLCAFHRYTPLSTSSSVIITAYCSSSA